jgi:hypothetical protein
MGKKEEMSPEKQVIVVTPSTSQMGLPPRTPLHSKDMIISTVKALHAYKHVSSISSLRAQLKNQEEGTLSNQYPLTQAHPLCFEDIVMLLVYRCYHGTPVLPDSLCYIAMDMATRHASPPPPW